MKAFTEYLTLNVPARMGFVNITSRLADCVTRSGVQEGLLLCNAMHKRQRIGAARGLQAMAGTARAVRCLATDLPAQPYR